MLCLHASKWKPQHLLAVVAILWSTAATPGCSDSPSEAGGPGTSAESAGDGSLTLKVLADIEGEDDGTGGYETQFVAVVTDTAGSPVSAASVTVTGAFGTLTLQEDNLAAGTYRGVLGGYTPGSYTLDVSRDTDYVTGVTTRAPEAHAVTTPVANDSVVANTALNVRWTRPATADETRLETRDYDSGWFYGDQGTSWVPSVANPPRTDQRIRVHRRNVQIAARGLAGSRLSVGIRRTVEPILAE